MIINKADPEVFVVKSLECGFCTVYDNFAAAKEHKEEMNVECPNDHYWVESHRLRSK